MKRIRIFSVAVVSLALGVAAIFPAASSASAKCFGDRIDHEFRGVQTSGADVIIGTNDNDTIQGGAGEDKIDGRGGRDNICGGRGDDTLWGRQGADDLSGGRGDDALRGGEGNDFCDGGLGFDNISSC